MVKAFCLNARYNNIGRSYAASDLYDIRIIPNSVLIQTDVCKKYTRGKMADFVAYYRVSTDRQGVSGPGLDALAIGVGRVLPPGQALAADRVTPIGSSRHR
jgi:hypothetical protein